MRYILSVLIGLLFISAYGQEIKEDKIVRVKSGVLTNLNDFVYDAANDEYAYIETADTVTFSSRIISSKGNSKVFDEIRSSNILFDKDGNYYSFGGNNTNKDNCEYSFIKNGKEIAKFSSYKGTLVLKNNIIYFTAGKNFRESIYKYDIESGKLSNDKEYKYIRIPYPQDQYGENFNEGIPFTKKGVAYYIAGTEEGEMLVTGKSEGKKYPMIEPGSLKEDVQGNLAYTAMQSVDEYKSKYLIYKGTEYVSDDFIGYNYDFDYSTGLPVYTTSKQINDSTFSESYWRGNDKLGTFNGQIFDLLVTPKGKIALSVMGNSSDKYSSFVVFDGEKSRNYYSAYNLFLTKDEGIVYIAASDTDKYFIMQNDRKISDDYYSFSYLKVLPDGSISYAANPDPLGSSPTNKTYIFINDRKMGPFYTFVYEDSFDPYQVAVNSSGGFAFSVMEMQNPDEDYNIKGSLITDKWTAPDIGFASNLNYYKNDLYFNTWINTNSDGNGYFMVYKNKKPITDKYDTIINYKFDKDKKMISFTGAKKDTYYYVTINF